MCVFFRYSKSFASVIKRREKETIINESLLQLQVHLFENAASQVNIIKLILRNQFEINLKLILSF